MSLPGETVGGKNEKQERGRSDERLTGHEEVSEDEKEEKEEVDILKNL